MVEASKINIGLDANNRDVKWEFQHKQLSNNHLLLLGTSGQGKTYELQRLLEQASNRGISSIIFDYTEGFSDAKLEKAFKEKLSKKLNQRAVYFEGLPINPFRIQNIDFNGKSTPEKLSDTADRVANIFSDIFRMGQMQRAAIYHATLKGLKGEIIADYDHENSTNEFADDINYDENGNAIMDLFALRYLLSINKNQASDAAIAKITSLVDKEIFSNQRIFDWCSIIYASGTVTIFQMNNFSDDLKKIITEFMLADLWYYTKQHGDKTTPFICVLDECQNVNHKQNSISAKILTEGRKFGWSAWFATQFIDGLFEKDVINRLQQSSLKLYFKPTKAEASSIAKQLDFKEPHKWQAVLEGLNKGACIACCDVEDRNGNLNACIIKATIPKME